MVITWNDGELLGAALASASASVGVVPRLITVDNGSDPPPAISSDVTLVRNETNLGVAAARNQGTRLGQAPFVCILDSDARLDPECLRRLVAPLLADPTVGLTAPVFTEQLPEASAGRAPTALRKLLRATGLTATYATTPRGAASAAWDVDFAIGACQVFRRDVFDAVGGLDEGYFYGPEDVDFCLRLQRAGYRVVQVRDATCHHPPRRRNRRVLSRRGLRHAWAVGRHCWRHRHHQRRPTFS